MRVYCYSAYEGANKLIEPDIKQSFETLGEELEEASIGDVVTIKIEEMDEKKYADLPEWDGP